MSDERGLIGELDFEALDCALGLNDGKSQRIYEAMQARELIDQHGHIVSWHKRQPKREREDNSATERKRQQRAKEAKQDDVTPCHATSHQKTPRGEESREENISNTNVLLVTSDAADLSEEDRRKAERRSDCPHQDIIALYHEILPMCPQVRDWTPARAAQLRARWNEDPKRQTLTYWRDFFEYVKECDFLVGRVSGRERKPFLASLVWLTKPENFAKVREGNYENKVQA